MADVSGFGPPPGTPPQTSSSRPASYLPPGGLRGRHPDARRPLLTNAHKPGIIPLRPLSVSDLLDGAAKHVRRSPGPILGTTLVTVALAAVPSVLVAGLASSGSWYYGLGLGSVVTAGEATGVLLFLGVSYAVLLLCGVMAVPVSRAALGQPTTAREVWVVVRPRLWRLLLLDALLLVVATVPGVGALFALTLVADAPGSVVVVAGVLALVVILGWVALVVWRTGLAGPVVVLEQRGVRAALRRSWALSRGSFWRIAGSTALVGAIAGLVFSVLGLVLGLLSVAVVAVAGYDNAAFDGAVLIGANLTTLLASAVVAPFVGSAVALLYVDARMRREGFDVVLQRTAAGVPGLRP
ncbi:MAG: glycerophosphoryl diester phosphodiesterase membrane domain-containing protein [Actinomycetota bacterium]|nr:glycerophosphoryl diester phosphodiesterase membrane domain-containing protein [Actinomycetota bacterium]